MNNNDLFFIDICCRWNAHYWVLFTRCDWQAMHRAEIETDNYRKMRQM